MQTVSIPDAARLLDVSQDTIRRRIRKGLINARKETTAQGFSWLVDLPDDLNQAKVEEEEDNNDGEVKALRELVKTLQQEVDSRRREVQELHVLLQQSYALLPAAKPRHWWHKLLPSGQSTSQQKSAQVQQ